MACSTKGEFVLIHHCESLAFSETAIFQWRQKGWFYLDLQVWGASPLNSAATNGTTKSGITTWGYFTARGILLSIVLHMVGNGLKGSWATLLSQRKGWKNQRLQLCFRGEIPVLCWSHTEWFALVCANRRQTNVKYCWEKLTGGERKRLLQGVFVWIMWHT